MELRHIRYFLAVAEELNFTKAAGKLCIAQPPLSRQIKDLEEELGSELFIRKARNLQLTEAGHRFLEYAHKINDLVDQSMEEIKDLKSGLKGMVYIASVEGQGPHLISGWIAGFHERYPEVQFTLWNGNSDEVLSRVRNGLADFAIVVEPYDAEGFLGISVYQEPWVAMIPSGHPLAALEGESLAVADLGDCDLIVPSRASRVQEVEEWFAESGLRPHVVCRMAHMLNAYELTCQNVGIALYPASAAMFGTGREGQTGGMVVKRLVDPEKIASYVLVRSKERGLSLVASEFYEYILEDLKRSCPIEEV